MALIYPFPLPKKYIFLPVQKHVLHVESVSDVLVICGFIKDNVKGLSENIKVDRNKEW